ncbi:hypothetical protein FKP32DRAFT_1605172 [Trametes sanguinea]|nr:hypothetical protein FKP32DRAFT_1605172 [Trametes sanguinea]
MVRVNGHPVIFSREGNDSQLPVEKPGPSNMTPQRELCRPTESGESKNKDMAASTGTVSSNLILGIVEPSDGYCEHGISIVLPRVKVTVKSSHQGDFKVFQGALQSRLTYMAVASRGEYVTERWTNVVSLCCKL